MARCRRFVARHWMCGEDGYGSGQETAILRNPLTGLHQNFGLTHIAPHVAMWPFLRLDLRLLALVSQAPNQNALPGHPHLAFGPTQAGKIRSSLMLTANIGPSKSKPQIKFYVCILLVLVRMLLHRSLTGR
jgi:hypothetical protein